MAEPEIPQAFTSHAEKEPERNWLPMALGGAMVLIVLIAIGIIARNKANEGPKADPYTAQVQVSNLHMATAENFAGGSVTYIEGTINNAGDKKLTGAQVQVFFKNSLGETAQKETLPVMVVMPNTPYVDYGTLDRAPLAAHQSRGFRLTLEHVSADWDGQIPAVRVVAVTY
jgi:hypothetical protein